MADCNTPLISMDRSSRQKTSKETQALNDTKNIMDLIDIYKTFHLKVAEYTFFSNAHGTFSRADHRLGHKVSSVAQSCPTFCDPMNRSTPGLPVHHKLQEFTQTHAH